MYFQDLDHSFSQYEPPNRQITCIYDIICPSIHLSSTNLFVFCLFVFLLEGGGEGEILYLICLMLANLPFISNAIIMPSPTPYPYEMMQG